MLEPTFNRIDWDNMSSPETTLNIKCPQWDFNQRPLGNWPKTYDHCTIHVSSVSWCRIVGFYFFVILNTIWLWDLQVISPLLFTESSLQKKDKGVDVTTQWGQTGDVHTAVWVEGWDHPSYREKQGVRRCVYRPALTRGQPTDTYKCIQRIGRTDFQKITIFSSKMNLNFLLKIIICYCHYLFPFWV